MALRTCTVSYQDSGGIRHSVDVTAESLFEAAVLGLQLFHAADLVDCAPGIGTHLEVYVREGAVVRHEVPVSKLREWLYGVGAKSPKEMVAKERFRSWVPWLKGEGDGALGSTRKGSRGAEG